MRNIQYLALVAASTVIGLCASAVCAQDKNIDKNSYGQKEEVVDLDTSNGQTSQAPAELLPVVMEYRGYKIHGQSADILPDVVALVKTQIDICEEVTVPKIVRSFFHSVPVTLVVSPEHRTSAYTGVNRSDLWGRVTLRSGQIVPPRRPILLHEFLHGVHAKLLADGPKNEEIIEYYQRAKSRLGNFEKGQREYFLSNKSEFFAVTASIYLFGDIPRAPFSMKNISEAMPRYAQYLRQLFSRDLVAPNTQTGQALSAQQ